MKILKTSTYNELVSEIDRLKSEVAKLCDTNDVLELSRESLNSEVECLNAELAVFRAEKEKRSENARKAALCRHKKSVSNI